MQILGVGYEEILLVAALIVIVVGPRRLPEMAWYLGRGVKKLQRYARVVRDEFSEEFDYLNQEMEAVRSDMQEVRTTVREVQEELSEVRGEVDEVTSEAVGELGEVRDGIAKVTGGDGADDADAPRDADTAQPPAPASANGAAAEPGVNGAEPVRGVPGPSYMPPIATAGSLERERAGGVPAAPESAPASEGEGEADGEAGEAESAGKPLVF